MTIIELEALINERTETIWMDLPDDLRRLCEGVSDTDAGTNGQMFAPLLFVQSELRGLALNGCHALLLSAEDAAFTLTALKTSARLHLAGRTGLLDYLGMREFGQLFSAFLGLLDHIEDRATFVRLLKALKTYGVRLHMWSLHVFPWELGLHMRRLDRSFAEGLLADIAAGPRQVKAYRP